MDASILFLGTGGSMGIPVIGCECSVCQSPSPFNKRLRPSLLLSFGGKKIIIDVGPDFRYQALKYGIKTLDGIILTHTHFDHIAGIDDVRIYCFQQKKPLPCLLSNETLEELKIRYHYLMPPHEKEEEYKTKLAFQILSGDFGTTTFQGMKIKYVSYLQMNMKVNGFRFGNIAYITDISRYSQDILDVLKGVEILIISGTSFKKSRGHITLEEAMELAGKVEASQTYLTHITHETDHEKMKQKLPSNIELSYDGLELKTTIDFI